MMGKSKKLTRKEREILGWMAEGKTRRQIALHQGIAPSTVSQRIEVIYRKMGVRNRIGAVMEAFRERLVW
jgi:LuxR family quorum sensing-dependent transcriptional regulator